MATSIPPNLHEEIDALDEIERALVRLTTADLEGRREAFSDHALPRSHPSIDTRKTVIPAKAGTHAEGDAPTESEGAVTQRGDGSRRSPGVS